MLLLLTLHADTTRPSLCYERWFGRSKVNLHIHSKFLIIGTRTSTVYSKPFLNTINPSEQLIKPNSSKKVHDTSLQNLSTVTQDVVIDHLL